MPPPDKSCPFGTADLSADEIADIDPEYLYFLRHARPEGRAYVVEIPSKDGSSSPKVIRYEEPDSFTAPNADPPAPFPKEEHSPAADGVPSGAASPPASPDGEARGRTVPVEREGMPSPNVEPALYDLSDVEEDYRFCPQHSRLVNDSQRVFGMGKVKEEVQDTIKKEDEDSDENEGMDITGPELQLAHDMELEMEMEVDEEEEEEEEEPLNVLFSRIPELEPSNREASSRQGHSAMPLELEGVIWPSHIVERPESDFKRKLMMDLNRPFIQEEYDELFAKATGRTPVMRERRTRHRVIDYPWEHEMGKSYFDSYPDLADQVKEESSYPNRLALLRGFFFWLKNIGHEKQFRPWRDDYKKYRVLRGSAY